jgi:hypothetical protein
MISPPVEKISSATALPPGDTIAGRKPAEGEEDINETLFTSIGEYTVL